MLEIFADRYIERDRVVVAHGSSRTISISLKGGVYVKKRDDLKDVIREETGRGKKRPVDTDAIHAQEERRAAVLHILQRGTREDLRALLKAWGYSRAQIEAVLREYDAAL